MIVFPLGRMCMLNRDGSKWKHVVSTVKNCKVHKYVAICIILNKYQILMKGKRYFAFERVHLSIGFFFILSKTKPLKASSICFLYNLKCQNRQWASTIDDKHVLQYADWFLLKQMSKNVDSETFGDFLESLNKEDDVDKNDL